MKAADKRILKHSWPGEPQAGIIRELTQELFSAIDVIYMATDTSEVEEAKGKAMAYTYAIAYARSYTVHGDFSVDYESTKKDLMSRYRRRGQ